MGGLEEKDREAYAIGSREGIFLRKRKKRKKNDRERGLGRRETLLVGRQREQREQNTLGVKLQFLKDHSQ